MDSKKVAVVGYSFRFPQTTRNNFWNDLVSEKDFITEVEADRWSFDNFYHPDNKHPGTSYTFKAGSLGDVSQFDAEFFGISPREAAVMDPQQRYLLEMTWEAIEHAGIPASKIRSSNSGVYIGISSAEYANRMGDDLGVINANTATGNTASIASNRISYAFDFQGPSMSVDTACSSAMIAFHQACQSILSGEVETAITGGISLHLHPFGFISFSKATMLSPDGRCKVFDKSANGYVRSEGGGIFLLKDYEQAVHDGDNIHAIVAATAVNTDGYKSGITIPSCTRQMELMQHTYSKAHIGPDEVDYIEAHGTGTPVGDPIEARSISDAVGTKRSSPLPIGSVKGNLGHLEPASGVAGLIKALLILRHRKIPATISMKTPNPDIKFEDWNIRVVQSLEPIEKDGPVTVGVNSFGFGGANAHVILTSENEKAVTRIAPTLEHPLPLILSGKNETAVRDNAQQLIEYLHQDRDTEFYDICWNYCLKKERLSDSALIYSNNKDELIEKLTALVSTEENTDLSGIYSAKGLTQSPGPVFVYSGNGCQWETMGKELLEQSEIFSDAIHRVDQVFSKYADFSLVDEIKGLNGSDRYERTEIAQPALFALQVGITEHLKHKGVIPIAVTGHSVGEVAAAWSCGALSLEDAVRVIYNRSYWQGTTKSHGAMTAVGLSETDIKEILEKHHFENIHLAGINSSRGVTLAGSPDQLSQVEALLERQKTFNTRLPLDYAFHSPIMDTIESSLLDSLDGLAPKAGKIPFISTVTGTVLSGELLDATYWWKNIRQPVLFKHALDHLFTEKHNCFIEIGPHPILKSYQQDQARENNCDTAIIPTLSKKVGNLAELNQTVAAAIIAGATNFNYWFENPGNRLELPTYAWQKEKHWHPVSIESHKALERYPAHILLGSSLPLQNLHWENCLDYKKQPWLADHQVGESVVFPGAAYLEMALQAAAHIRDSEILEIEDLEILAPLVFEEGQSKILRTKVDQITGEISILSRTQSVSEQWTPNCKARSVHQPIGSSLDGLTLTKPSRAPDFDLIKHQQITLSAGLQYGPAFSAIKQGWIESESVITELEVPSSITDQLDQFLLHPGLLDSAMQSVAQLLANELENKKGIAFVPIRIDRVTISKNENTQPTLVRLTLQKRAHHSLLARYELFNSKGEIIAVMDGLRLRAVRLYKEGTREISFLDYHLTPAPKVGVGLAGLAEKYETVSKQFLTQTKRYADEVAPLLDNLILHAIAEMFSKIEEETSLSSVSMEELNLRDPDRQFLRNNLLSYALDMNILEEQDGVYEVTEEFKDSDISSGLIWDTLVRDYPDYFTAIHLCGSATLDLKKRFQGNDEEFLVNESYQKFYKDLHNQTLFPALSKALLNAITEHQPDSGQRLDILEISAIKPYYAQSLCSKLNFNSSNFTYASYNDEALDHFSHIQERYPLSNSVSLDLELSYSGKQFPFAIATIDNFDIQQNLKLVEQFKNLLSPGATIYLSGLEPIKWIDFLFGSIPDWWQNDSSCQTNAKQWQNTLQEHGFSQVEIIKANDNFLLSAIWLGEKNSEELIEDTNHWLFLSNKDETELAIVQAIQNAGIEGDICDLTDETNLTSYIVSKHQSGVHYSNILLLNGLSSVADLLNNQTDRTFLAACVSNALEKIGSNATIYILTQGVSSTYSSSNEKISNSVKTPQDAALWGFGRTLMNEALNNSVRMLDLPYALNDNVFDVLIDELRAPSDEHELLFNEQGERYAPRLRFESKQDIKEVSTETQDQQISLGFDLPGQLKSLRWQAKQAPQPEANEVEIEIRATGLNFRDIMYALGLLSDEAIENGFAGATMGLEFSGTVISTGPGVESFQIGDEVVGFGSACFSNRIIASTMAISPIPEGINFEGAATIPSTFLTVYYALKHLARIQPGERVLIHGAAGGVGIAAIQIAQHLGAEIYATVGSKDKRDFLQLMGIPKERIFNSRQLTYAEEILNTTPDGKGVDIVLNSLAGEAVNQNFRVLKPFGRFLELGKRDFYENTHIGLRPFRNNISYFGIDADQLQLAQPELTTKMFRELIELFNDGTLFPLPYTQFDASQVVDAFRYMQQAKQIGKIVITYQQGIKADIEFTEKAVLSPLELNSNATYLITGGLGGFGLRTAKWLVEKGARHLLLLNRRGASSDEAAEFIRDSSAKGINVVARACDVTSFDELEQAISLCGNELPPLKGVIHAATLINDTLVRNISKDQIKTSLAAKMLGAEYLDRLTEHSDLDMFVLYSSCTTLMGNPGQAAYVAANHWLEALAANRKSRGLPATCVRWGAIDDVGFLARNEDIKDALHNRLGGKALSSEQALNILEQMLINKVVNLGVMELDWGVMSRFLPSSEHAKFIEIDRFSAESEHNDDERLDLETMMKEMTPEEFNGAIMEILTYELSEILMIPMSKINPDKSIYDMGMDSLMGVELMSALEAKLGIQIPVMSLADTPKISQLTDKIIGLIKGDQQDSDVAEIEHFAEQHGGTAELERLVTDNNLKGNEEVAGLLKQAIAQENDTQRIEN